MNRLFKIFLLVALSVFSTLNLSANDTFFSIEKSSERIEDLADGVDDLFSSFTHLKNLPTDAKTFLSAKNWDNAILTKLDGDLATTAFKNAVDVNPQLIDAWKVLDDAGANDLLRLNPDALGKVTKYLDDEISFINQNGIVKALTKSGDEIGEVLNDGLVKGKYSKRPFNPSEVGGDIIRLSYDNAVITSNGIADIKTHLSRLDPDDWNPAMIKRLEDIEAGTIPMTDFDKRFYTHELRELERTRSLGLSDAHQISYDEWNNLHSATLEDYSLFEKVDFEGESVYSLYHPSVQD